MRIAIQLAFQEEAAVRLLNWLAQENARILRARPDLPALYDARVVYRRERGEAWCDYLNLLARGWEDCDGLAAARAGELLARGWRALTDGDPGFAEARRLKLAGMDPSEIPSLPKVLKASWHLFIPLVVMVTLLLMQYTPFLAAFWGITLTVACSWIPKLLGPWGRGMAGMAVGPRALVQGFEMGAKSALGIGAACACVGFVLGITTLTGMGFKFSAWVLDMSGVLAQMVVALDPLGWLQANQVTVLFGLLFTAVACIIMGAGVPTTPTYIILAAIVAPAMEQLGVPQLATHFFVFYFGVLADVTPPVALAAFAAAGIARSEPMRTGMTAFRLSMGKALVPFAFVYTPALLFIDFSWGAFLLGLVSVTVAVIGLAAAYTGFLARPIGRPAFLVFNVLCLSLVFANPVVNAVAIPLVLGLLAWHARPLPDAVHSAAA